MANAFLIELGLSEVLLPILLIYYYLGPVLADGFSDALTRNAQKILKFSKKNSLVFHNLKTHNAIKFSSFQPKVYVPKIFGK